MRFKSILICMMRIVVLSMAFTLRTHASFIETTQGTAVINDATATFYNPAALALLKNPQLIGQETLTSSSSRFTGQSTTIATGINETGASSSSTRTHSPSFYLAIPASDKMIIGLAVVSNSANREADGNSVLRYIQASNTIQDCDVVPAFSFKINDVFSIGGGINFSYANFDQKPIIKFPNSNIIDRQNNNKSNGMGVGGNIGFLLRLKAETLIGFNYRSITTYHLNGTSIYEGPPEVISDQYQYKLWTPARSVFSINHFIKPTLGFISTVQYIQWSTFTNVHVNGIASLVGNAPLIVNGTIPYHLHDTWLLTLGSHYRLTPKWIIRVAGTFTQSPGNPHYQIVNGDSVALGASASYEINKTVSVDGSYAHAFIENENINISGNRFLTKGRNEGARDAVSLKLTCNIES